MANFAAKWTAPAAMLVLAMALPVLGAERQIAVEPGAKQVKRFEKIELSIRAEPVGDNPYDPAEIDLKVELTSPGGKTAAVPAFYFQPFERREVDKGGRKGEWLYPVGMPVWKARFAPTEVGTWTCAAALKDMAGAARSAPAAFECVASPGKGFVRVSRKDPRYLEFDDGSPFFAVGQNVAFVTDSYRSIEMLRKLGAAGGNFARVWACSEDWAMAIEARKSAWGRSWAWNPPLVVSPDREAYHAGQLCLRLSGDAGASIAANPCRPVALRPGTKYRLSGKAKADQGVGFTFDLGGARTVAPGKDWTAFQEEFTAPADQWWLAGPAFKLAARGSVWLKDLSLKEAAGGPELLWEADPNRPVLGVYNQPDCFMVDRIVEAAEEAGVYLQLVLLTRDHYMYMLKKENSRDYGRAAASAGRLVRYASARWGCSTHVAAWEYFNEMDPGLPTSRFYDELGRAFDEIDVNRHVRATSGWASPTKEYKHPRLDTADMHFYLRPAEGELFKDELAAVQARWKVAGQAAAGKPLLFSEFGMTDDKWQRAAELDKDKEFVHLHNALWASALSGFASTVCHWYWDDIHKKDMYHHYRPIAAFVADIPFTTAGLRLAAAACDKGLRVVGLQGEGCAYLWISDPRATWWKIAMEGAAPAEVKGAAVSLEGLAPGAYRVQWWDTREGKVVKDEAAAAQAGAMRLVAPAFSRDIACKVVKAR
jgi:hypothetical protein